MKKLFAVLLITSQAFAGLPPTTSKISGDSSNVTTFNFQFPNLTGTHTGTTVSIPIYPVPSPSPSSVLMDVSGAWSPVPFPSPSPSGQFVMANGTGFTLSSVSGGGSPGGITGNIQYDNAGSFAGSNNLFWDIANSRLGIGTSIPSVSLDVNGAVRDRNLSTAGIVSTDASGNLGSASNSSTFTTLYETIATTLGDLIYGGASGAPTRLAGNTQNSAYVLTSQASGGVATAPAWQPISAIGISTDWSAYTATLSAGFGTATSVAYWRRLGDSEEIKVKIASGTLAASVGAVSLGGGCVIDTSKLTISGNDTTADGENIGYWTSDTGVGTANMGGMVTAPATSTSNVYFGGSATGAGFSNKPINMSNFSNSTIFTVVAKVPCTGWSSNTIGASQGAVYAHYYQSANQTINANLPWNFDTKIDDSGCLTGSCLVTTGASWKFTAPVTGTYAGLELINYSSGTAGNMTLYKNGSFYEYVGEYSSSISFVPMPFSINLSAGDYIDIRPSTNLTANGGASPYQAYFSINLQSGNGGGNISSSNTNSYHDEAMNGVCSTGSSITAQSLLTAATIGNISSGCCAITLPAGEFSATPWINSSINTSSSSSVTVGGSCSSSTACTVCGSAGGTTTFNFNISLYGAK